MSKTEVYKQELAKLTEIFADVEPAKAKLVEGLIKDASFLYAENQELRELMSETGMIKIHPQHRDLQKQTEAAKQFLKNVNSYSVIIKTLNGILTKGVIEDEEDLDEFE